MTGPPLRRGHYCCEGRRLIELLWMPCHGDGKLPPRCPAQVTALVARKNRYGWKVPRCQRCGDVGDARTRICDPNCEGENDNGASRPEVCFPVQHCCVNLNAVLGFQGQHKSLMPEGGNLQGGAKVEVDSNSSVLRFRLAELGVLSERLIVQSIFNR